jgi:hypothetical protein
LNADRTIGQGKSPAKLLSSSMSSAVHGVFQPLFASGFIFVVGAVFKTTGSIRYPLRNKPVD